MPLSQTEANEAESRLSPDGRWLAYVSRESEESNVYVRPFPSGEGKWQISVDGGAEPRWRGDGKELFYLAKDQRLMAVPINAATSFEPGVAKVLFETSRFGLPPYLADQESMVLLGRLYRFGRWPALSVQSGRGWDRFVADHGCGQLAGAAEEMMRVSVRRCLTALLRLRGTRLAIRPVSLTIAPLSRCSAPACRPFRVWDTPR